ncbi:hypothetical protein ABK040_008405 [Willaertia magna]
MKRHLCKTVLRFGKKSTVFMSTKSNCPNCKEQQQQKRNFTTLEVVKESEVINQPEQYKRIFLDGVDDSTKHLIVKGLWARVCRGRRDHPEDFSHLGENSENKVVFMFSSDGLTTILNKMVLEENNGNGNNNKKKHLYDILRALGFEDKVIHEEVEQNKKHFELVIISGDAFCQMTKCVIELATWEGVFKAVKKLYPDLYPHIEKFLPDLQNKTYEEITRDSGFDFFEILTKGLEHPKFLTEEKLMKIIKEREPTLVEVRAFLYFDVGLRELFRGDGYTLMNGEKRGFKEYLVENVERKQIEGAYQVIPFDL